MSEGKPTDLQEGYLGEQSKFSEMKMECVSHKSPEFELPQENEVEIKFRVAGPVKATSNLIQVRSEQEYPEFVFTQTDSDIVSFVLRFPEHGWYKFQVFAMPASEAGKSLPNVFNYLIDVRRALKAVYPFPKQYAPWRNGCFLFSPLQLNSSCSLFNIPFKVSVPTAKDVVVVASGEWFHLKNTGGSVWEEKVSLDKHRNKNVKVTLNARFTSDEDGKYSTLLEYWL